MELSLFCPRFGSLSFLFFFKDKNTPEALAEKEKYVYGFRH